MKYLILSICFLFLISPLNAEITPVPQREYLEALTRGGVRARDIRKIDREYEIYRVTEEATYDLQKTISFLVDKLNKKYDYFVVLFLGLLKLLSKIRKSLKITANKWQKDRDYFCSEFCYEAFFFGGGLDIVPDIAEADITSPGDIAKSELVERMSEFS